MVKSNKQKKKKFSIINFILYLLLLITIIIIYNSIFPGSSSSEKITENSEVEFYSKGDLVQLSDSEWILVDSENVGNILYSNNFLVDNKTTNGKFISITFTIKNISQTEIEFNPFISRQHPNLYDSKGREFKYIDDLYAFLPKGSVSTDSYSANTTIPPGIEREFYAIYEVARDGGYLYAIFKSLSDRGDEGRKVLLEL